MSEKTKSLVATAIFAALMFWFLVSVFDPWMTEMVCGTLVKC